MEKRIIKSVTEYPGSDRKKVTFTDGNVEFCRGASCDRIFRESQPEAEPQAEGTVDAVGLGGHLDDLKAELAADLRAAGEQAEAGALAAEALAALEAAEAMAAKEREEAEVLKVAAGRESLSNPDGNLADGVVEGV